METDPIVSNNNTGSSTTQKVVEVKLAAAGAKLPDFRERCGFVPDARCTDESQQACQKLNQDRPGACLHQGRLPENPGDD